jgi:hypothetical protein
MAKINGMMLDIFQHALKFSARQIELSPRSGNLSVRSHGSYLFHVDMNQVAAGFSQFDPRHRSARDATTTERALCTRASCDVANEAFSSVANGFEASFTAPVWPLEIIDSGRWANKPR